METSLENLYVDIGAQRVNWVKNPNWLEANQLAIYKDGQGFELGTTKNKSS